MISQKELSKILVATIIITLLLILTFTANLRLSASPDPSLTVTAETDKKSYLLRQKVMIEGNITQDGSPASDLVVVVQAENPNGMPIAFRTLTIGNPTQIWPINITDVSLMDMDSKPINTAKINTLVQVGITIYNWQLTKREVCAKVTAFDANMVPLQVGFWNGTIDPQQTISLKFTIYIPKWACSGKALICGNVYTKEPKEGGIALSLEKTTYFCISRTQFGLIEYPSLPPPPPQTTPGIYNTYIRLPPDPTTGRYIIYIQAQTSPIVLASTSATFNVKASTGYPPQASFVYWPATPYENMTVEFDASSSTPEGYNDTITKYEWDFGDGTPKVIKQGNPPDPTATHKYINANQYIITLNVTDNEGLWSTTSKPITVLPEFGPTANFTWTPEIGAINRTVTFDASASTEGWSKTIGQFSPITSYKWNFSDGTGNITVTTPITYHNFTQPGNYTVTLTVIDSVGRTNYISHTVQVLNITLVGDITGPYGVPDCFVDYWDISMAAGAAFTGPGDPRWEPRADITGPEYLVPDNYVDYWDISLIASQYGKSC